MKSKLTVFLVLMTFLLMVGCSESSPSDDSSTGTGADPSSGEDPSAGENPSVGEDPSTGENPSSNPDIDVTPGSAESVFTGSDVANERFGLRSTRKAAPEIDAESQATVVRAINDFSIDLHRAATGTEPGENSVESGYSAAVALSLAYAGTSGSTRPALANMLGVDDINETILHNAINSLGLALNRRSNDDLVLHTANRVFVRPGLSLQDDYLDIATGDYGAPVVEANFAGNAEEATRLVNAWVSRQTDGFIPTIIDRFNETTVFALLNTIFLDADWQFEYESGGERPFNALDGSIISVDNFYGKSPLPFLRTDDLLALEIPYGGGDIAMLIMMPTSLVEFESTLDAGTVDTLVSGMLTNDVTFFVPNWEDEAELDLVSLLAPLGSPPSPWDFGRMIEGGALLDVFAKQKARIEVDENGTRAAAVTVVGADESAGEFASIDRPFLYMIRDRVTGLILFTGRVVSP